jgi:Zn-dependent membrane protease YugP
MTFSFFDPLYLLILMAAVAVALWAQWKLWSARAASARAISRAGLTGADAARAVLRTADANMVRVVCVDGEMSDYYHAARHRLRLSGKVYSGTSLTSTGVAAHEAAHGIQDVMGSPLLRFRNIVVPAAGIGSSVCWIVGLTAIILNLTEFLVVAILLFTASVLLQLANLPAEYDASRRAGEALTSAGLVSPDEEKMLRRLLDSQAWAHVAATITGAFWLAACLIRSKGSGRHPVTVTSS